MSKDVVKQFAKKFKHHPDYSEFKHGQLLDLLVKRLGFHNWNYFCACAGNLSRGDILSKCRSLYELEFGYETSSNVSRQVSEGVQKEYRSSQNEFSQSSENAWWNSPLDIDPDA